MNLLKVYSTLLLLASALEFIVASSGGVSFVKSGENRTRILSRKRRYLIFPTGSSFSVATCMTIGIYGNPQYSIFSWGLNWGFAYDLPTNSTVYKDLNGELDRFGRSAEYPTAPMKRRAHRKSLYSKMETIMDAMGYNGRECIQRALCESSQFFGGRGSNLIAELIRTIFSFPRSRALPFEHDDVRQYDAAHRVGRVRRDATTCSDIYPNCGFSLIKLALGHYAKPLQNYM